MADKAKKASKKGSNIKTTTQVVSDGAAPVSKIKKNRTQKSKPKTSTKATTRTTAVEATNSTDTSKEKSTKTTKKVDSSDNSPKKPKLSKEVLAQRREKSGAKKAPKNPVLVFRNYLKGSWYELRQVRWPSRGETWRMVGALLLFVAFFMILIIGLDAVFKYLFDLIVQK